MDTCRISPETFACQCGTEILVKHRSWNCALECRRRMADRELRRWNRTPPKLDWLLTITNVPPRDSKPWSYFMRSLRGRWELTAGGIVIPGGVEPRTVEYARILELGAKHGMRHYHLAIRGDLPSQHHLSNLAKHFGYGFKVDVRRITNVEGIKSYLLSYLLKASGEEGRRKISYSRNFWEHDFTYRPYVEFIPEHKGGPHIHKWRR